MRVSRTLCAAALAVAVLPAAAAASGTRAQAPGYRLAPIAKGLSGPVC
jgi:hypothetical protein